jgi:SAM-dependent methyltransferase
MGTGFVQVSGVFMRAEVQRYYGEVLQTSADLKTNACCTTDAPPEYLRQALRNVHPEVLERYYGCGLVLPEAVEGTAVLDLGSGAGRDVYILSQLVGQQGQVVGVDMTPAQLDVARRHMDYHRDAFGYAQTNVEFVEADIEHLDETGLEAGRFDLVVSNCVINLARDKRAVLEQTWRLLRDGGELYFADIYADRRIPESLRSDPVLYGECLAGALYWNDFLNLAGDVGFIDARLVDDRPVAVTDPRMAEKVGEIRFFSATYRLFKLPELEPGAEDYGQSVRYRGSVAHHPDVFALDKHHIFPTGKVVAVSGNTKKMLTETRLKAHFDVLEDAQEHRGCFPATVSSFPFDTGKDTEANQCC